MGSETFVGEKNADLVFADSPRYLDADEDLFPTLPGSSPIHLAAALLGMEARYGTSKRNNPDSCDPPGPTQVLPARDSLMARWRTGLCGQ